MPAPSAVGTVLLVSTTGLGDTVMATPSFAAARESWPHARINALLHRRWADLLAACPHLDEIIVYPGKFRRVVSLVRRLRRLRPDVAVILHGNDPDIVPLTWLSGAGFIVGRSTSRLAFLMDKTVDLTDPGRPVVEKFLDLIQAAAGPVAPRGEEIFLSDQSRVWAEEYWREKGLGPGEKLVALNPGGSRQAKRWPDEHWRSLMDRLHRRTDTRLALFGSPGEKAYLEGLVWGLEGPEAFVVTRPRLSEAAALLARAEVLVAPD
ncbi:MAG: glycosyltransferase family 9 protein, partial [Thermodesulfobacteriota bacterium]